MSDTRETIADHIHSDPGVHFSELVRALDLAPGQTQYHLRRLDSVVAEEHGGKKHYFPADYDARERAIIARLRRETSADVVAYLLERGPTPAATVADDLEIARSTLEYHLDGLIEVGVVAKRRGTNGRVTLTLERPVETARLLGEADPTLFERMADRFTRLVDDLLD